ncbi:hypothetical protein CFIO01_03721 [Colletotrichum fioriniae PJ7]|uniref:Tyrosinase copper-binding domain-containing protein n=1 Tax=Colletotrichum fioriniae PJ7 TaxID=1445577 RepID=A0A010R9A2_9PEZI|nr:hypothetical protein CFIO01_03721 [Colletotrichum fioriniae PJ7]
MRLLDLGLLALQASVLGLASPVSRSAESDIDLTTTERLRQLASLAQIAFDKTKLEVDGSGTKKRSSTCSWHDVRVRREWGTLSKVEKLDYINAVKCLQSRPARTPASESSGAKTRFDDFVATHINQTLAIHYTGNFLSWHRYFTWQYEEALRNECGYKGTQPYWDWSKTAITGLENSPIFDGSETSMSGNGDFVPGRESIRLGGQNGLPIIELPVGTGGGCVNSGPFKNLTVNLGPAALDLPGGISEANPNGPLTYNPRCLKRDLTTEVNLLYANVTAVLSNILQPQNVYDFQMQMQGVPGSGNIGIHGGGHYSLGGDPGRDVFTSPGDPAFYLHHSMIDRVWWMWQMLSPQERQYGATALGGTNTFLDQPPSANTTMDDVLQYGWVGESLKIRDAMSTVAGPLCYVYL